MKYAYEICFAGNHGRPLCHDPIYASRELAHEKAPRLDRGGLRYGAFVKRIRVSDEIFAKAVQQGKGREV